MNEPLPDVRLALPLILGNVTSLPRSQFTHLLSMLAELLKRASGIHFMLSFPAPAPWTDIANLSQHCFPLSPSPPSAPCSQKS